LTSESDAIRSEAASALGELITSEHLPLLLQVLQQDSLNLQLNVLILLRKIHDAAALPAITPFFTSIHPSIREAAVTTLRYLNQVKQCPPAVKLIDDADAGVRRATALTLAHLADEAVISALSQAIRHDPDWQVRRNAAQSLAVHAQPTTLPTLRIALTDLHWQVRKTALQAMQKLPDAGYLSAIAQLLADEFSDVRKEAVIALGALGQATALNALQQALDDPDREVSIQAERAIRNIQIAQTSPNC
jgi:HEAT repeat protein